MSLLEKFKVSLDDNVLTSTTTVYNASNLELETMLGGYMPNKGLRVETEIVEEDDNVYLDSASPSQTRSNSLKFKVSKYDNWSQGAVNVLNSLRFREIIGAGVLAARLNPEDDGVLAKMEGFSLIHARLLLKPNKPNDPNDKTSARVSTFYWLHDEQGNQSGLIRTCWTWGHIA